MRLSAVWLSAVLGATLPSQAQRSTAESIVGSIRESARPRRARLTFLGDNVRIEMTSNRAGRFTGVLPRLGVWRVQVADEGATREIGALATREPDGTGRVDIDITEDGLRGMLVDEDDRPFDGLASLRVDDGSRREVREVRGGAFRLGTLSTERLTVHAETHRFQSAPAEVLLTRNVAWSPIRLVMRLKRPLAVAVVDSNGRPLAGARLLSVGAEPRFRVLGARIRTTDASGGHLFDDINAEEQSRCLTVRPKDPAMPARIVRVPIGDGKVTITMDARGGDLVTDARPASDPWLLHDGCPVWLSFLRGDGGLRRMAAGEYALCPAGTWSPREGCAAGILEPGGRLVVEGSKLR